MVSRGIRATGVRNIVDAAIAAGWKTSQTGNGHLAVTHPKTGARFTVSMTAKDNARTVANTRADARRAGLVV